MGPITKELYKQIKGWRIYSVIAPAVFCATAALLYIQYGTPFQTIFFTGLIVLSITCISWWHWSLSTMVTMLAIMKDTDDHFELVAKKLELLRTQSGGRPDLKIIANPVDTDK
jgi:hypothetical protein